MGSIVIFRISSCPPLFVVYQYHTCNWFYFSYFLLYKYQKDDPQDFFYDTILHNYTFLLIDNGNIYDLYVDTNYKS